MNGSRAATVTAAVQPAALPETLARQKQVHETCHSRRTGLGDGSGTSLEGPDAPTRKRPCSMAARNASDSVSHSAVDGST
jgi:hypothetical protein